MSGPGATEVAMRTKREGVDRNKGDDWQTAAASARGSDFGLKVFGSMSEHSDAGRTCSPKLCSHPLRRSQNFLTFHLLIPVIEMLKLDYLILFPLFPCLLLARDLFSQSPQLLTYKSE
jgi:hypothetical protein